MILTTGLEAKSMIFWANNLVELCPCTEYLPKAESKK